MKALIFDTETTGLPRNTSRPLHQQPSITELYAKLIETDSGDMINEFHSHFNPAVKLEKEAAKVTGLTMEFLEQQPKFSDKINEIIEIFEQAEIIVGHNLSFDLQMLALDFERCGADFWHLIAGVRQFCTVEATEYMFGFRPNLTLLHETFFGCDFEGTHGAKADTEGTERCFMKMVKDGEV